MLQNNKVAQVIDIIRKALIVFALNQNWDKENSSLV
jgi:hypothetical protein